MTSVMSMKTTGILVTTVLMAAFTAPALADSGYYTDEADAKATAQTQMSTGMMPMANGQMPKMANMEKLLQQLVELQKR